MPLLPRKMGCRAAEENSSSILITHPHHPSSHEDGTKKNSDSLEKTVIKKVLVCVCVAGNRKTNAHDHRIASCPEYFDVNITCKNSLSLPLGEKH